MSSSILDAIIGNRPYGGYTGLFGPGGVFSQAVQQNQVSVNNGYYAYGRDSKPKANITQERIRRLEILVDSRTATSNEYLELKSLLKYKK